jgi:hypothetical protein
MYRLTNADWTVIESGARLQDGDKVYAFGQYFARSDAAAPMRRFFSGMVAMTDATFPGAPVLARKAFEDRLKETDRTLTRVNQLLAAPPTAENDTEIFKLLQSRAELLKAEMAANDTLGSKLAARLSAAVSPAQIASVLAGSPDNTRWVLEHTLESKRGRSYLLERVGDPHEVKERRRQFADLLSHAGSDYAAEVAAVPAGDASEVRADFSERLARLAVANLGTDLSAPLLRGIASCAGSPVAKDARLVADLQAASKVLAAAFAQAAPVDRFDLAQTIMQIDPDAYHMLLPAAGPLLTLVEPDRDFDAALKRRALHLACRFRNQLAVESELKLVLRPLDGKPEIEIPVQTRIGTITNNFGNNWLFDVAIPVGAAGKCHVFLRDYLNDHPNGNGLGFEIDVPKN